MTVHVSEAEVAQLFDLVVAESATLAALRGCVEQLQAIQDAKRQLAALDGVAIRAGLALRRDVLGDLR